MTEILFATAPAEDGSAVVVTAEPCSCGALDATYDITADGASCLRACSECGAGAGSPVEHRLDRRDLERVLELAWRALTVDPVLETAVADARAIKSVRRLLESPRGAR